MNKKVFVGNGAGFAGDRFDAAIPVVRHLANCKGPRYLMYEVLGERTIALAQKEKLKNPNLGYSPYLENYMKEVLTDLRKNQIKLITNMGAANCQAAALKIHNMTKDFGLSPFKIAIIKGDNILEYTNKEKLYKSEVIEGITIAGQKIHSANVYLGAKFIADALSKDVDIVIVGRTTDSALVLGPLMYEFNWKINDLQKMASGTICGHLLECGAQVSGAYFVDPGFKDVPNLETVGFPIAEVEDDGTFVITKPKGTGGCVTKATVTEQLLYEMHDPANYLVPEVSADITDLTLFEEGEDRIKVCGIRGKKPPEKLKVTVCLDGGWMAETEMSYSGSNAFARAELAGKIVKDRMQQKGFNGQIRMDVIGAYSVLDGGKNKIASKKKLPFDGDYRLRLSLIVQDKNYAQMLCDELQMLYCSGPAAGGGYRGNISQQMSSASILVERSLVEPFIEIEFVK